MVHRVSEDADHDATVGEEVGGTQGVVQGAEVGG